MIPEEEMVGWRPSGNAGWEGGAGCPFGRGQGRGSSLAALGEMGKAFGCFAEVARVCGPWPPGMAMDLAPIRSPARPPAPPSTCRPAWTHMLEHLPICTCQKWPLAEHWTYSPWGVQVPCELCNLKGWPTLDKTGLVRLFLYFYTWSEILCFFLKRMIAFNVCTDLVAWLVRNCHLKKEVIFIAAKKNTVKCIIHNFGTKEANRSVLIFIRWWGHLIWGRRSEQSLEWPASVSGYKWIFFIQSDESFLSSHTQKVE